MKKYLISLVPVGVIAVSTVIIAPVVAHQIKKSPQHSNERNIKDFLAFQQNSSTPFVNYDINKQSSIVDSLNQADINLFYNGAGAITTVYMQQLSLLAAAGNGSGTQSREVHYAMAPDKWEPQAKVNWDELTRILHLANPNSSLINVHKDSSGRIVDEWVKIIKANPGKKINVWWNSDHLTHENGSSNSSILDLAAFKNVNIQLLEDGAAISDSLQVLNDQNLNSLRNNTLPINDKTQYILPSNFNNIRSWFTSPVVNNYTNKFDFLGHFQAKDLPEALFNTRIDDSGVATRISSYWTKVSGNDWHAALTIMTNASQARPGKKNMLILGSYGMDREEEYIKYLYNKYHDDYNIFYKGHPGHMEHTDYVLHQLCEAENLKDIYAFEPSIASEELTRDHYKDGIKFDKLATIGRTSALAGFPDYDLGNLFTDTLTTINGQPTFVSRDDMSWESEVEPWLTNI